MADQKIVARTVALSLIVLLFFATLFVLRPLLLPIITGLVFAYFCFPIYKKINQRIKSNALSALIVIVFLFLLISIPVWFVAPVLINQIFETYMALQQINLVDFLKGLTSSFLSPEIVSTLAIQLNNLLATFFNFTIQQITNFVVNLPVFMVKLVTSFFVFFFALKESDKLGKYIRTISPFSKRTGEKFFSEFRNVTDGVLYGQILIGILQGLGVGILLKILGVEGVAILTVIAIVAGILPLIGPSVIWIPVGLYLISAGFFFKALVLIIGCNVLSWLTEGVVRPYVLSRKTVLPLALGFLSTLGGLLAFGIIGLVIGPILVAYSLIILDFYRKGNLKELFSEE